MFITLKKKSDLWGICIILFLSIIYLIIKGIGSYHLFVSIEENIDAVSEGRETDPESGNPKSYIKWVQFDLTHTMMEKALKYDIESHDKDIKFNWIELLAYAVAKNWGNVDKKCVGYIDDCVKKILNGGTNIDMLTADLKYYKYYLDAYTSILGGFVGEYEVETIDPNDKNNTIMVKKYGLKVFSPIAKGYSFSHYRDFGVQRSYGYARPHLGNDLLGSVGTPIIAVESGVVEALGWNQYGGWRVGIRSDDQKRYYYYAHLKKNHPFHKNLKVGDKVTAGDVIGYLGMTGYSVKENVNNITTPHLHFGMQLIFNEVQKDGSNQIWIDVYHIVELLNKNKSAVTKNTETGDFDRKFGFKVIPKTDREEDRFDYFGR